MTCACLNSCFNYNLFDKYSNLYKYVLRNTNITYLTRDLFSLINVGDVAYDTLFILTILFAFNKNDKEFIEYLCLFNPRFSIHFYTFNLTNLLGNHFNWDNLLLWFFFMFIDCTKDILSFQW